MRFASLSYGVLADLITARVEHLAPQARPIVEQYVEFVRDTLARSVPSGVKQLASPSEIVVRKKKRDAAWNFDEFLQQAAEQEGGSDLVAAQRELLDLFTAMEDLEPRFESTGNEERTYTLAKGDIGQLAWIY